jgi:hypothetical protein
MAGVFQNIDPPLPSPPAFGVGGGHTRWVERGVWGQYFGRRQAQLRTLQYVCKYTVPLPSINSPPPLPHEYLTSTFTP